MTGFPVAQPVACKACDFGMIYTFTDPSDMPEYICSHCMSTVMRTLTIHNAFVEFKDHFFNDKNNLCDKEAIEKCTLFYGNSKSEEG